ncbi:MAG: M64 family metallopeptidase [Bacteroidales bacterium]|nr:M64 family metallopeptidase [Bacteroidales bacterium]
MKKEIMTIMLAAVGMLSAQAVDFQQVFSDSTLRIDLRRTAERMPRQPKDGEPRQAPEGEPKDAPRRERPERKMLDPVMSVTPGWWGRTVNLDTIPYRSTMVVSIVDLTTGQVYYKKSYLRGFAPSVADSTVEVQSVLMPLPKVPSKLIVADVDNRGKIRSEQSFDISPAVTSALTCAIPENMPRFEVMHRASHPNPVRIAIVAEGFTQEEMPRFRVKADSIVRNMLTQPGWSDYADRVNIIAVEVPSRDSGITKESQGEIYDTALGARFAPEALDRLIVLRGNERLVSALSGLPYEHAMVIANTETYGGCGPYNTWSIGYGGPWLCEVSIHEFGHTFAGLGDEYEDGYSIEFPSDIEPQEPNITTLFDFSNKWQNLIDEGKAGLVEGAGYVSKGVWRGCPNCLMRTVQEMRFCPVCAQAIAKVILLYTESVE